MFSSRDEFWMQQALRLAEQAKLKNEVPVGAVLVLDDEIVSQGYNRPISTHDPCAHAEIIALRTGAEKLGNYRLINTTLYVTLEPCIMCAGAMVHARIKQLIFGASDIKAGAIISQSAALDQSFLNHRVSYKSGLLAEECGRILSRFFQDKRQK